MWQPSWLVLLVVIGHGLVRVVHNQAPDYHAQRCVHNNLPKDELDHDPEGATPRAVNVLAVCPIAGGVDINRDLGLTSSDAAGLHSTAAPDRGTVRAVLLTE